MTEEFYNKIDKFRNETDWSKYPIYEHALEEFIKGIVAEEIKELKAQIKEMKCNNTLCRHNGVTEKICCCKNPETFCKYLEAKGLLNEILIALKQTKDGAKYNVSLISDVEKFLDIKQGD